MARSLNKVMIIGRVGRDPEMKFTPGGEAVANFSVATSRSWLDQSTNERREVTEWHNIVAWRRLAETCKEFLTKGRLVYIEGRLETRSWDDRETGKKMYRTEVIADEMNILEPRSDGGAGTQNRGGLRWRWRGPRFPSSSRSTSVSPAVGTDAQWRRRCETARRALTSPRTRRRSGSASGP
jgi:single-strand DNA-binding protein